MNEIIKFIPFELIDSIQIYENNSKLSLSTIVNQTKADYIITGVFYTYNWKPTCQLKKDGTILVDDGYEYNGFKWNTPLDFQMDKIPTSSSSYLNHYACCDLIVKGQKNRQLNYNSDVGGVRGRTAIGIKGNQLVLYASKDGTSSAKTPEQLRDYLYSLGVQSAILGDGGSKVNYYDADCLIQGSAKSQNLIVVYLKKENNKEEGKDMKIIKKYITNNPRYKLNQIVTKRGYVQHSTGTPGAMANSIISAFNSSSAGAETHGVIDDTGIYQILPHNIKAFHVGGSANTTHVGVEVCEPEDTRFLDVNWYNLSMNGKNNTSFAVKAVQQELNARGYNTNGIDGIFGNGTKSAVISFQKDQGLSADGIVGKDTLHKLQNRKGSYVKYDPEKNKEYFENVYKKAVYYCAYILKENNITAINENTVLSHAEAYKKGIGSNHADVGHWWPEHNKSMDDFREDVKNYIQTGVLPFESKETVDTNDKEETEPIQKDEMTIAWEKAVNKGIFDGTNPDGCCTRKQVATVLNRLKLLD